MSIAGLDSDSKKINKHFELTEKVKDYIFNNYLNSELNLSVISSHFNYSAKTISSAFKDATDTNVNDYINQVRINKALEIIKADKKITIEELSEKTGYNNSRTFRRAFNKITGTTPKKMGAVFD